MVDLENNNLNISLLAEENISSSLISENLQVIFDTSTNISVKPALSYIKSGQKEINDYVSDVAEPRLSEYVQTAENQMQNCVNAVQKFADDIVDKGFVKTVDFQNALEGKQEVISDLSAIRNGATLGATAVQPADLASVATSGSYNDLSNKPDLNGKADIDLSNITSEGKNIANWSTNVTNCITEIPQDIKLELNNGTLTLKAGSKVYVPNGSENYIAVTISADKSIKSTGSAKMFVCAVINGSSIFAGYMTGGTITSWPASPVNYAIYYYAPTNVCAYYNGSSWVQISFPIAVVTRGSSGFESIDQVFNGFGYIGSTVFALPGVKGLIPNGRNEDGSLKNIECSFSKVVTQTNTVQYSGNIALQTDNLDLALGDYYDEETNYNRLSDGRIFYRCIAGKFVKGANGVITSFTPKTAFHAVDYNDKETVVGWGMPDYSARISISSPYTVPKNGIVCVRATSATSYFPVLRINGVDIFTPNSLGLGWALASKGDVASLDNENNAANFYYIPFKGEN